MASRIIMCLFHLSIIKKVVEMCKGGSTTDSHFFLHGTPAGGIQRCDCNLTSTGAATSVHFTSVNVTNTAATCGGTLTLIDGSTRDCGWTSRADFFMYPSTSVVSFAYSAPDVRFCVEFEALAAAANISIECPLSTTTTTLSSSSVTTTNVNVISSTILTSPASTSPLHILTSTSTSTPSSTKPLTTLTTVLTFTKKSTTVSLSENRSTSSPFTNAQSSTENEKTEGTRVEKTRFPGFFIAGWVIAAILVAVIVVVVVLLIRKQRQSNYESRETCQQSVSTQTDSGSIYERLDQSNVAKPDTLYERIETQSAGLGIKDYYNIEMGDYCNP